MSNNPKPSTTEQLIIDLRDLLEQFENRLNAGDDLRPKVLALVPAVNKLRDIGISLLPVEMSVAARERILQYLLRYPHTLINGSELMVIAGISEWARRVRELRTQFGWKILNGSTVRAMVAAGELDSTLNGQQLSRMRVDDYILISTEQDKKSAYRWNLANAIRRKRVSAKDKIEEFLLENVGEVVSGDELQYVGQTSEWARRVRELRTEEGYAIFTKQTGRPDLQVGEYILASKEKAEHHDRHIPIEVQRNVLRRDNNSCVNCGWNYSEWNSADPRHLQLHHLIGHAVGGPNNEDNLITLCNRCHVRVHSGEITVLPAK